MGSNQNMGEKVLITDEIIGVSQLLLGTCPVCHLKSTPRAVSVSENSSCYIT